MAYCRLSRDSDVYVYASMDAFVCHGRHPRSFQTPYRTTMLTHLIGHRFQGDLVPQRAISRLTEELDVLGDKLGPEERQLSFDV